MARCQTKVPCSLFAYQCFRNILFKHHNLLHQIGNKSHTIQRFSFLSIPHQPVLLLSPFFFIFLVLFCLPFVLFLFPFPFPFLFFFLLAKVGAVGLRAGRAGGPQNNVSSRSIGLKGGDYFKNALNSGCPKRKKKFPHLSRRYPSRYLLAIRFRQGYKYLVLPIPLALLFAFLAHPTN